MRLKISKVAFLSFFCCSFSYAGIPQLCEADGDYGRAQWGDPQQVIDKGQGITEWVYQDQILTFKDHKLIKRVDSQGTETSTTSCGKSEQPKEKERKLSTIDGFRSQTQYHATMCTIKAKTALQNAELGAKDSIYDAISNCVQEAKSQVKPQFSKAYSTLGRKPNAAKALKEYYVSWLTGLDSLSPRPDDRVVDYRKRIADADSKTSSAWNTFEVESGL